MDDDASLDFQSVAQRRAHADAIAADWLHFCAGAAFVEPPTPTPLPSLAMASSSSSKATALRSSSHYGSHDVKISSLDELRCSSGAFDEPFSVPLSIKPADEECLVGNCLPYAAANDARVLVLEPELDRSLRVAVRSDVWRRLRDRYDARGIPVCAPPRASADGQPKGDESSSSQQQQQQRPNNTQPTSTSIADGVVRVPKRASAKEPRGVIDSDSVTQRDAIAWDFRSRAYAMLLRYFDLSRGDAGQHGVVPRPVFDVLQAWGCTGECFATPFNATMDDYCSPFYDVDEAFGSDGSFFARHFEEGCFEINPPFSLKTDSVVDHLASCLQSADALGKDLAFVLIHHEAYSRTARHHAAFSSFIVKEDFMNENEHYYYEGAFFYRAKPRAYVPPFRSVVIFAMTETARRKWPVTPSLIAGVRRAFAWPIDPALPRLGLLRDDDVTSSALYRTTSTKTPLSTTTTMSQQPGSSSGGKLLSLGGKNGTRRPPPPQNERHPSSSSRTTATASSSSSAATAAAAEAISALGAAPVGVAALLRQGTSSLE